MILTLSCLKRSGRPLKMSKTIHQEKNRVKISSPEDPRFYTSEIKRNENTVTPKVLPTSFSALRCHNHTKRNKRVASEVGTNCLTAIVIAAEKMWWELRTMNRFL